MKKILILPFILISLFIRAQSPTAPPSNYTGINFQIYYRGMMLDRLHLPTFNTTPSLRTGQFNGAGAIGVDTVNHRVYFYSGSTWRQLSSGGSVAGNEGYLQLNRNSSFAAAATDTLKYTTAAGLNVKNIITSLGLGVGTTSIDAKAIADFTSTTKGILVPRLTTTQQNAITSPTAGLLIWNTDSASLFQYTGAAWQNVHGGGSGGGGTPAGNYGNIQFNRNGLFSTASTDSLNYSTSGGLNVKNITTVTGLGVGTTSINASAIGDFTSTTKGLLAPRMNTTQQNAIGTPATGLLIFNTDSAKFRFYDGAAWTTLGGTGGGGGPFAISGATDANVAGPANNNFFQYKTSDNKWHNVGSTAVTDITDPLYEPTITTGLNTQYWRGDKTMQTHNLNSNTDVVITSPSNVNSDLYFDGSNLKNRARSWVDVRDYGAVGDGTTNDYTAFVSAVATGKDLYIPGGFTFLVNRGSTNGLELQDNQKVYGDGPKSRLKVTQNGVLLWCANYNEFYGLRFTGSGKNAVSVPLQSFIMSYQHSGANIHDCQFDSCGGDGSNIYYGGAVTCAATNDISPNYRGMRVSNCSFLSNTVAVYFSHTGEYSTCENNLITQNTIGIWLTAGNYNVVGNNCNENATNIKIISDNNSGHGIIAANTFNHATSKSLIIDGITQGQIFTNCKFYYGSADISNCNGIIFIGCDILDPGHTSTWTLTNNTFLQIASSRFPKVTNNVAISLVSGENFVEANNLEY